MPDLVFVRANRAMPVKAGGAVSTMPNALGSGAIYSSSYGGMNSPPSGQAGYAQTILANRFRNYGYYVGETGYPPDNATNPTF